MEQPSSFYVPYETILQFLCCAFACHSKEMQLIIINPQKYSSKYKDLLNKKIQFRFCVLICFPVS